MFTKLNAKFVVLFCLLIGLFSAHYDTARAQTQSPPYQIKIIVDTAKMRTGPGASFASDGYARMGDLLTVYQISAGGDWLLVQQNPDLWVSALQVEIVSGNTTVVGTQPASPTQKAPTKTTSKPRTIPASPAISLIAGSVFLMPLFVFWMVVLLIPLIFGFHWRWFIGSIVASIFFGPLGLIFAMYIAILVLFRSHKIATYSPRDLMEEFAGNTLFMILLGLALLILTAVSVLGGVLVIGSIYFYFRFALLFMPKGVEQQPYLSTGTSVVTSGIYHSDTSSDDDDDSSNDDSSYDDDYSSRDDDDDDDDDDDKDKGSAWDGWLVKW